MNDIINHDLECFCNNFKFVSEIRHSTCLVTGATGLIGSTIIRCLDILNKTRNLQIRIIGVVRNINKAKLIFSGNNIELLCQDLSLPINFEIDKIDYIFHCACPTSSKFYIQNPVELIKISVQGSLSVLDYAIKHPIKGMVYLSSCEIYGSVYDDSTELTEDCNGYINSIDVRSGYPNAKRLVETLCHAYYKEYNVPVVIARLTQTFGAGVSPDDNRVFAQFAKSAIRHQDIVLHTNGKSAKPYCYTIDAVNAMFYLLFRGEFGEAYNVANPKTYISIKDLAKYIITKFTPNSKLIIEENGNMGYAPTTKLRMSIKKLQSLGWKPHYNLDNMFESLINYYKSL